MGSDRRNATFLSPGPSSIETLSLILSFLLGFFLETSIGLLGFWFLEISSLLFVYMLLSYFLSGHMFPIDMLPGVWGDVVRLIPVEQFQMQVAARLVGKALEELPCQPEPERARHVLPSLRLADASGGAIAEFGLRIAD